MNIEKKNNYLVVTGINDLSEALRACYKEYDNDFFGVIFVTDSGFEINDEIKKLLDEAPFVTAVYSKDLSGLSASFIMSFDLRFSDTVFSADKETAKALAESGRFRLLFGEKKEVLIKKFAESGSDSLMELEYLSVASENYDEYFTRVYKDKTPAQIKLLTECLTALRGGVPEKGFEMEAKNYYELLKEMVKEG